MVVVYYFLHKACCSILPLTLRAGELVFQGERQTHCACRKRKGRCSIKIVDTELFLGLFSSHFGVNQFSFWDFSILILGLVGYSLELSSSHFGVYQL